MKRETFHHGNLRAELLALAADVLASEGAEALSLRDLASRLGVSRAAPYRHFSSKDELLQAVAIDGLEKVTAAYERAEKLDAPPRERLRAACEAYLDFAEEFPGLFGLLFSTKAYADPLEVHALRLAANRSGAAFDIFERLVAAAYGINEPTELRLKSLSAWSLVHGFAILKMHGLVQRFADAGLARSSVLDEVTFP